MRVSCYHFVKQEANENTSLSSAITMKVVCGASRFGSLVCLFVHLYNIIDTRLDRIKYILIFCERELKLKKIVEWVIMM